MRVGTSLRSGYVTPDHRGGARWMIERAQASYEADLDSLFVGDHHGTGPFPYYQNVAIMGRLLAEWHGRPAGVLLLLPLWNPVLAAEQLGTLAAIHDGPFILQCAVGGGREQFEAMGADIGKRPSSFEASLSIIRRLLAGEEVSSESPWRVDRARIAPLPPEPVEVWIGAAAPPAIDRAARLGDAFLIGPEAIPREVGRLAAEYRERCAAHGRDPGPIAVRRDVHVAADRAELDRVATPVIQAGYRGFDPAALIAGEIGEVIESFAALADLGAAEIVVRHLADDQAAVLASIERLRAVRATVADL